MDEAHFRILSKIQSNDPSLTKIGLYFHNISNKNVMALIDCLSNTMYLHQLVELDFEFNGAHSDYHTPEPPGMDEQFGILRMTRRKFPDVDANIVTDALSCNTTINHVTIKVYSISNKKIVKLMTILRHNVNITKLGLCLYDTSDACIKELANCIHYTRIIELCVHFEYITDNSIMELSDAMCKNTSITLFSLSLETLDNRCPITDSIILALHDIVKYNTKLTRFDLHFSFPVGKGLQEIFNALYYNTTIKYMKLMAYLIVYKDRDSFLNALNYNTTLEDFQLCGETEAVGMFKKVLELTDLNEEINNVLEHAHPIGDGYTDAGDFDDLTNEIFCEIATQLWNTSSETAFALAHTCRRARDCVFSDWTAQNYLGTNHRYNMRHLFRAVKA